MFRDRVDAAQQLADRLRQRSWTNPVVLAIPRGGVVIGAVLARELNADLDVVLSRKLRAPTQPELAIGAIREDGTIILNHHAQTVPHLTDEYIEREGQNQLAEIVRRKRVLRSVRPPVPVAGRSVIVTDDGIATGSTMIAALQTVRSERPREIVVAVPVAAPDRLEEIRRWCDDVVCLLAPDDFWAIGQFYEDFSPVEDDDVIALLRDAAQARGSRAGSRRG